MTLKYEHPETGQAHEAVFVHLADHDGMLIVDRMTGVILTPLMERPDWCDGLAIAILQEHQHYWESRTGSYTQPQLFDMRDLSFIGMNSEQEEVEVSADPDYRMDILAERYGLDREEGDLGETVAELEFATDNLREAGEVQALEEAGAEVAEKAAQA